MKTYLSLIISTIMLSSCTGGSGGLAPGPSAPPNNGVFVDSPVGGAFYRTATLSGMTDDSGKFQCRDNETVEIFLKGDDNKEIILGSVECRGVISPIDLVTSGYFDTTTSLSSLSVIDKDKVIKILQILQSLDTDGNAANGISLRPSEVTKLSVAIDSEATGRMSISTITTSSSFQTKLDAMMTQIGRPAISASAAEAHFATTQAGQCQGDSCQPGPGPTPAPPSSSIVACMSGVTYANNLGGVTSGTVYPINPTDGSFTSTPVIIAETRVILKSNGTADIYRQKSGYDYYKFTSNNYLEVAESLTINNIGFSNGNFTLNFGAESMQGLSRVRYATENSVGLEMSSSRKMWIYETNNCANQVPTSIVTGETAPTPTPSPSPTPPPSVVQCLIGQIQTKTTLVAGQGYQAGTTYDINQSTGAITSAAYETEWQQIRFVLKSDGSADVYRNRSNNVFYKYSSSGWATENGNISVLGIGFSNGPFGITLGAETEFAGSTVREGFETSVGKGDIMHRRFSVLPVSNCNIPNSIPALIQ